MDDKKKIIFLSIAVVVAIGLIVLITLTKRGGETAPAPSLPAVPTPTFPAGTYTGVSGGTGGSGGQGGAGQTGNTAAVSSPAGFNAFVYGSATSSSALGAGNYNEYLHIKPAPAQPKASVPTMNISENDIVAEVTKELKGQISSTPGAQALGLTTDAAISKYVSDLMNLSTNEAELQSLLSTLNGINGMVNVTSVSPQNLTEQLMNATSDAAITSIVNSISSLQGINSSQLAYLQSLSTATSTSALNQSLINLGSQNQDFLTSVLSNASGSISADQLQQLLQQFNASSSAECSQISQQIAGLNSLAQQGSSSGASDVLGLSAIAQYIPTQSCSGL